MSILSYPLRMSIFLLTETGGVKISLGELAFHTIQELGKYTPNVVYTNNLFKAVYRGYYHERVSTEQYIAELMHWLSQPSLLGDVIKPVVFGTHTVGYSLAAIVKADHEDIEIPTQPQPGALGRLLHLNPFAK